MTTTNQQAVQYAADRLSRMHNTDLSTPRERHDHWMSGDRDRDIGLVVSTYLAELDSSKITLEKLKADGWDIYPATNLGDGYRLCYFGTLLAGTIHEDDSNFIEVGGHWLGCTMGEIRTVVRLRQLQEARRLSRQSSTTSTREVGNG